MAPLFPAITLFLFLIFCLTLFALDATLFKRKPKIFSQEDSRVSKSLINIILNKETYIEIDSKTSLPTIVADRKNPSLSFIGNESQNYILVAAAEQVIEKASIFRNCFTMQDFEGDDKRISNTETATAVFKLNNIEVLNPPLKNQKLILDVQNITLSTYVPNVENYLDLEYYGVSIGDQISLYENKIFIEMISGVGEMVKHEEAEDVADIYSAIRRLKISNDLAIILPKSYKGAATVLEEELKTIGINAKYFFIPDLALYKNKVRALVLEKFTQIVFKGLQSGEISIGVVLLDNQEIFIQSLLREGFALSGLNKVIIFDYS